MYKTGKYNGITVSMEEAIELAIETLDGDEETIKDIYASEDVLLKIYHVIDNFALRVTALKLTEIEAQYEILKEKFKTHTNTFNGDYDGYND